MKRLIGWFKHIISQVKQTRKLATLTAKKRFVANSPVKAGELYKYTITQDGYTKTYILRAKFTKTLTTMNPMWFENLTPKEYYFSRSRFNSTSINLMPGDKLYIPEEGKAIQNNYLGFLEKAEAVILMQDTRDEKIASLLMLVDDGTDRMHKLNLYPWVCKNYQVTKYFSPADMTGYAAIYLSKLEKEEVVIVEIKDTFTPTYTTSKIVHTVNVYFGDYTPITYQGISPVYTYATYCTYEIPNSLTSRKLTVTKNGAGAILKFEVYA